MKKLFVFLLLFMVIFTVGCNKNNEGVLRVAVSPDYAPFEFIDLSKTGQDKFVGSDIEFAKYIANKLNKKLEIVELDFDACLMAVSTNNVDISISGFSWTPTRAENYELSKCYLQDGEGKQQVLILQSRAEELKTMADLNKSSIKVGAQSGTVQEELVNAELSSAKKELFVDFDLAVAALLKGTIDALAAPESVANIRIAIHEDLTIFGEDFDFQAGYVVVAKKGKTELMSEINNIIDEVISENLYQIWLEEAEALAISLGVED